MQTGQLIDIINMMRLGVNIDHVATLREQRRGDEPETCFAALICQSAGADSIVAHLREDRRHIKERDLLILKQVLKIKLNLEMSIAADIVDFACDIKPDQVTLVPEKRQELTTEGGLDVISNFKDIKQAVRELQSRMIPISFFIDPENKQIDAAKEMGIQFIELHTGRYAGAKDKREQDKYFKQLEDSVDYAKRKKLTVFAGHGLNYYNTARVARIEGIEELNIGHSIICRAVLAGLDRAVREMKALL